MSDNVNHPSHYTAGDIECIDAINASMSPDEYRGYLKGNVIKYLWRYRLKKGDPLEDIRKAQWYLTKLEKSLSNDPRNAVVYANGDGALYVGSRDGDAIWESKFDKDSMKFVNSLKIEGDC